MSGEQIGVGKTFFMVDGLDMRQVKAKAIAECKKGGDWIPLVGESQTEWGAVRPSSFLMIRVETCMRASSVILLR